MHISNDVTLGINDIYQLYKFPDHIVPRQHSMRLITADSVRCISKYTSSEITENSMVFIFSGENIKTRISVNYSCPLRLNIHTDDYPHDSYTVSPSVIKMIAGKYADWNGLDVNSFKLFDQIMTRASSMHLFNLAVADKLLMFFMVTADKKMFASDIMKHTDPNFGVLICRLSVFNMNMIPKDMTRSDSEAFYKEAFRKMNRMFPKYNMFIDREERWCNVLPARSINVNPPLTVNTLTRPDTPVYDTDIKCSTTCTEDDYAPNAACSHQSRYMAISQCSLYTENILHISYAALTNDARIILDAAYSILINSNDKLTESYDANRSGIPPTTDTKNQIASSILVKISMDIRAFKSLAEFFRPTYVISEMSIRKTLIADLQAYIFDTLDIINSMAGKINFGIPEGKTAKSIIRQCSMIHERALSDDSLPIVPYHELMPCSCQLPWYLEHFRIKTKFQMKYYGMKFHHCLGSLTNRKTLFFNWKTVCAEVNPEFFNPEQMDDPVRQCYDMCDRNTDDSKRFKTFLNAALSRFKTRLTTYDVKPATELGKDVNGCNSKAAAANYITQDADMTQDDDIHEFNFKTQNNHIAIDEDNNYIIIIRT